MLYFVIIFLSAALLFMVQPLIAKAILPWFGGGASVWTACMLFFQLFLLLGYGYSHLITRYLTHKTQAVCHTVLIISSTLTLPLALNSQNVAIDGVPQIEILYLLLLSIGLPYFVLSSTGPLLQRWFSYHHPEKEPYRLYALSNIGSLLGLIAYPFIIEPLFPQQSQFDYWSLSYLLFSVLMFAAVAYLYRLKVDPNKVEFIAKVTLTQVVVWFGLSMFGVILLLAVTNSMTQNIASVPFLWLLPLTLYLLSYIICFSQDRYYQRKYWRIAFGFALLASFLLYFFASVFDFITQVLLFSCILFIGCMVCHGELSRLRPVHNQLTLYYLCISFGGFFGGVFVSLIAPNLFNHFTEFPLVVFCLALVISLGLWRELEYTCFTRFKRAGLALSVILLPIMFFGLMHLFTQHDVAASRNFYGLLSVKDIQVDGLNERRLVDGTTSHGTQALDSNASKLPLSYYRQGTGVALAIESFSSKSRLKIGVVGLGAGTLAAYGRETDHFEFYELNPQVERYALQYFSYLADTKASYNVSLGDGRLLLQHLVSQPQEFDVLVIDAFSSDAIPAHLVTVEAVELYQSHLNDNGILAFHISNNHLDLTPLLRGLAEATGLSARLYLKPPDTHGGNLAHWVLLSQTNQTFHVGPLKDEAVSWSKRSDQFVIWRDDYSNLLSVLK